MTFPIPMNLPDLHAHAHAHLSLENSCNNCCFGCSLFGTKPKKLVVDEDFQIKAWKGKSDKELAKMSNHRLKLIINSKFEQLGIQKEEATNQAMKMAGVDLDKLSNDGKPFNAQNLQDLADAVDELSKRVIEIKHEKRRKEI